MVSSGCKMVVEGGGLVGRGGLFCHLKVAILMRDKDDCYLW